MAETHLVRWHRLERKLRIAEVAIAGLVFATGLIYAWFAFGQLKVMKKQGRAMHEQSVVMRKQLQLQREQIAVVQRLQEQADRPWVIVTSVALKKAPAAGEPLLARVELINSGQTPANNCVLRSLIALPKAREKFDFAPQPRSFPDESIIVMPSGGIPYWADDNNKVPLTAEQFASIRDDQAWIYVYGIVTYDIAGGVGETRFAYRYDGDPRRLIACNQGNYAR